MVGPLPPTGLFGRGADLRPKKNASPAHFGREEDHGSLGSVSGLDKARLYPMPSSKGGRPPIPFEVML